MKKTILTCAIVAAITMVGCKKESFTGDSIPATIKQYHGSNEAKVYIDSRNYSTWHQNDGVKLNGYDEIVTGTTNNKWNISVRNNQAGTVGAIFPATAVPSSVTSFNGTSTSVAVTLPATQTYETDGNGNQKLNALMAAKGTSMLEFHNLCALLKVQVPANTYVNSILVGTIEGNVTLWGDGNISFSGSTPVLNMTTNSNNNIVTMNVNAARTDGIFYVAIPATSATFKVTVKYKVTENGVDHYLSKSAWQTEAHSISANYIGLVNMGDFTRRRDYLPGIYSVSASKKVMFSSGNLLWTGGSRTSTASENRNYWIFNQNQYDLGGFVDFNHNTTGSSNYFSWYNSDNTNSTILVHDNSSFNGTPYDWGDLFNDPNDVHWCTLTKDEWKYLMVSRQVNFHHYAFGRINTGTNNYVNGLILFPDQFTWPTSVTHQPTTFDGAAAYSNASYTVAEWSLLEEAGCVFLPAGGHVGFNGSTPSISSVGSEGNYWTKTGDSGNSVFYFNFTENNNPNYPSGHGGTGRYVRLVYQIKAVAK